MALLRQNTQLDSIRRFRKGLLSPAGPGGDADRMLALFMQHKTPGGGGGGGRSPQRVAAGGVDKVALVAGRDAQSFLLLRTAFNA